MLIPAGLEQSLLRDLLGENFEAVEEESVHWRWGSGGTGRTLQEMHFECQVHSYKFGFLKRHLMNSVQQVSPVLPRGWGHFLSFTMLFQGTPFFLSNLILFMGILLAFMSVHHVLGRLRRSEDPEFPGIGVTGWLIGPGEEQQSKYS